MATLVLGAVGTAIGGAALAFWAYGHGFTPNLLAGNYRAGHRQLAIPRGARIVDVEKAWELRKHQDGLIQSRLQWFLVSQSFLFTAYATSQVQGNSSGRIFAWLIPVLGLVSTLSIFISIVVGIWAYYHYRQITGGGTTKTMWLWGGFNPSILPPIFAVAWIVLLFAKP